MIGGCTRYQCSSPPPKTQKTTAKKSPSQEGQGSPKTVSRDDTLSTPSTSDSDAPLPDPFLNT